MRVNNRTYKTIEVIRIGGEIGAGRVVPFAPVNQKRLRITVPIDFPYHPKELSSIIVSGNSMNGARILDGDEVIFWRKFTLRDIHPSKVCVVYILPTSELILRHVALIGNSVFLTPANPDYDERQLGIDDVEILGLVVLNPIRY